MKRIFDMESQPSHWDTVVRFKRDIEMRWKDEMFTWYYFGEWSETFDAPHGRGVWFGENVIRVGYFTEGAPSDGKVFRVITDNEEI